MGVTLTHLSGEEMSRKLVRGVVFMTAIAVALPPPSFAEPKPVPVAEAGATEFNIEQLDAMLAPIALYPDELLTQTLMASTYPLQVVAASRWLGNDDNKNLKGDALIKALDNENWDPSVKSLVPFPQVIAMMNDNLEWTQQLGYAVATQQAAVLDSIQRLRRQAEKAGSLKTTEQQRVVVQEHKVVIQPANPETVYVPVYNPTEVYGTWPYPSYPPVYMPPPPAYYPPGYALGAELAFAAGAAVVGGLWGWASPGWNSGTVNINAGRYNSINANRSQLRSSTWRPPAGGVAGRPRRPPGGPVGAAARAGQLPANAIGRANVQVPGSAVNRPQIPARGTGPGQARPGGAQRPGGGQAGRPSAVVQRPGGAQRPGGGPAAGQRPSAGQLSAGGQRVGAGQLPAGQRPGMGQGRSSFSGQRPAGAFGGIGDGARAGQYGARGMQSRNFQQGSFSRGGGSSLQARGGGGGFQARSSGGGFAGRGGGGRGGGGRR
jgi:hypothetical protein